MLLGTLYGYVTTLGGVANRVHAVEMEQKPQRLSEATSIKQLLKEDRKLWGHFNHEQVSDRAEEMCCGWKPVRPSAIYNLVKPRRKKAGAALYTASTISVHSKDNESDRKYPYMNGELDENYSYVYKGGLSNRAYTEFDNAVTTTRPVPQPHRHVQTVTLDHMHTNYASANALVNCRDELSRVLALQLKPELLVEQFIIENRLRTMSLAAFPVLQGRDSDSQSRMNDTKSYSHSTPALLPNTHVNYHRPPRYRQCRNKGKRERTHSHKPTARPDAKLPPMQWCKGLSSHKTSSNQQNGLQIVPSTTTKPLSCSLHHQTLHLHNQSSPNVTNSRLLSCTSSHPFTSTHHATNTSPDPNHPHYRLPPTIPSIKHTGSSHSKHMHTLLYNPNRQNETANCDKSNSMKTGSSFHYPQVSYYNSKPLNFK